LNIQNRKNKLNEAGKGRVTFPPAYFPGNRQADNRKDRYLTREEADLLLDELGKRSPDIYDIARLSLYTRMRFGEIANLRWGNVDLFAGKVMLRNTKSKKDRPAYMTPAIKTMLARRGQGAADDLVFPARRSTKNPDGNNPRTMVSTLFYKVIAELFNKDISDRKQWVNFHTFASWLVESDVNIWVVKDLLGHSDLKITERYAHVGDNQLQAAVLKLQ
jgi:integrase